MRLLYIGWLSAGERGAVGTHTAGILRALDAENEVYLTGLFVEGAMPPYTPKLREVFRTPHPTSRFGKLWLLIRYARWARNRIKSIDPDFVYVRFDPFFAPCVVRNKSIVEYNDIFLDQIDFVCARGGWTPVGRWIRTSWLYRKFVNVSEAWAFRRAKYVVAVTEGLVEYCRRIAPSARVILALNASDAELNGPGNVAGGDAGNEGRLVLGHIGTLTHWDGLDVLLEGMAIALAENPSVQLELKIVGTGAAEEDIRQKIEKLGLREVVSLSAPVTQQEAQMALLSIDVVPLLKTISSYGLSPIKFYEALALGRTLLVSKIAHIDEIPGFCGRIVSYPLSATEVASALVDMHADRLGIRKRREEIAAYAKANHSWRKRVEDILKGVAE